ncbi:hypothetical protein [Chromobacterium sp. IIBBL 290-4]|uniref:hypothetical protein n=1 Tax=Chromobacterium sp. IIBBL 290-4 TaxID=2953890 RepID=UPI0020B86245|nr:hypothetical protein [Chromobacterium sp. IIBBL 290-4]UTH75948.1 hypothetical protein NKT35_07535 [Chromobacterium sp. IIBBL 290-4]
MTIGKDAGLIELEAMAQRGRRAVGAMFFTVFGAVWLWGSDLLRSQPRPWFAALVAALAAALWSHAWRRWRQNRAAMAAAAQTAASKRADKIFKWVNGLQWLGAILAVNVLNHFDLPQWQLPAVMLIIGLHFFPLAWAFRVRAHYLTGAALTAWPLAYPQIAAGGSNDPVGCLGAGVILWLSAAYALRAGKTS